MKPVQRSLPSGPYLTREQTETTEAYLLDRGFPDDLARAFSIRSHRDDKTGCLLWIGGSGEGGYGRFRKRKAHRLAWEAVNGAIPNGRLVRHACDRRACVEPDHLVLGTHAENMADMAARSRSPLLRVCDATVAEIRKKRELGWSLGKLSREFGLSTTHLHRICSGRSRGDKKASPSGPVLRANSPGPHDLQAILEERAESGTTYQELGRQYGRSSGTIHRIVKQEVARLHLREDQTPSSRLREERLLGRRAWKKPTDAPARHNQGSKRLTVDQVAMILEGRKAGETVQQLAVKHGVSYTSVSRVVKDAIANGTPEQSQTLLAAAAQVRERSSRKRRHLSPDDERAILERWLAGAALKELGDEFGISPGTAQRVITLNADRGTEEYKKRVRMNARRGEDHWMRRRPEAAARHKARITTILPPRRGSSNARSKLTEVQVIEMRRERQEGAKLADLAEKYGISTTMVSNIVRRRVWTHV